MKQVVLESPGIFAERQAPIPVPAQGEALVHVQKVGVCGSDFHAFAGRHPVYTYPRVLGHELSGIVLRAPANERGIESGDRCVIDPYISCGKCRACLANRPNCCENLRVIGIHLDGGMQEFLSVPVGQLYKSNTLSLEELALVETLGIGAHAVERSEVEAGQQVIVVGAGPIGIGVAQFASVAGARVHIVERSAGRRRFIEEMGYPATADTDNLSAEVVFDATGCAKAMAASLALVATGGTLVYVGLTRDPVCIDDALLHRREVTLKASRNSCHQFPRIIKLIEDGKIETRQWITHRLTLSEVSSQFPELPRQERLIKAIVEVEDGNR
jgi:2-desacetyl-2-hydroxyethyl bacteriochlorophyllide A dehydrogenase